MTNDEIRVQIGILKSESAELAKHPLIPPHAKKMLSRSVVLLEALSEKVLSHAETK